jgi:hypothetical protein
VICVCVCVRVRARVRICMHAYVCTCVYVCIVVLCHTCSEVSDLESRLDELRSKTETISLEDGNKENTEAIQSKCSTRCLLNQAPAVFHTEPKLWGVQGKHGNPKFWGGKANTKYNNCRVHNFGGGNDIIIIWAGGGGGGVPEHPALCMKP